MNTWTDVLLVVAIVVGLISAAALPVVSVNAISSEALRLREVRGEEPPWLLMEDDVTRRRVAAWHEASLASLRTRGRGAVPMSALSSTGPAPAPGMAALEAAASSVGGVVEALPSTILEPAPAPVTH